MSLPHLLMGLLNVESLTGYDLNKRFESTVQNFWTVSQSQIYRALHKIEEAGWVNVETVIQDGSPNKKIYHLTESGREELKEWVRKPIISTKDYLPKMGQVFFGDSIGKDEMLELLEYYADYYQKYSDRMRVWYESLGANIDDPELPELLMFRLAPLVHSMQVTKFEAGWYRKMADIVRRNRNADNVGIEKWDENDE